MKAHVAAVAAFDAPLFVPHAKAISDGTMGTGGKVRGSTTATESEEAKHRSVPPKQENERTRPVDRVRSVALEKNIGERRSEIARDAEGAIILLVEDEDSVRQVAGEILQAEGYLVLEAKNGQEALRLLQRKGIAVDVLVTDVVMPGMNGLDLAEELTCRHREMRTIFISGYAEHPLLEKRSMPATAFYLRKPFSVEALTRIVWEALARK